MEEEGSAFVREGVVGRGGGGITYQTLADANDKVLNTLDAALIALHVILELRSQRLCALRAADLKATREMRDLAVAVWRMRSPHHAHGARKKQLRFRELPNRHRMLHECMTLCVHLTRNKQAKHPGRYGSGGTMERLSRGTRTIAHA